MTLELYLNIFAAIIGLCIGSFLNVVALRQLKGEEFVMKASHCPKCNNFLKWYDNIPVLSYLCLGGKCRFCKEKISIQYPIVEASTGIVFAFLFFFFGLSFKTLFLMILASLMIVMCITDIKEQAVFDTNSYPVIILGILYNALNFGDISLLNSCAAAVAGFVFFEIVARSGKPFFGERIFGEGDSIIAAGLGAFFGLKALIPIIIVSFLIQVIAGMPVVVKNMLKEKDYKSVAAVFALLFCIMLAFANKYMIKHEELIYYSLGLSGLTMIIAIISTVIILGGIKERQSFTLLPFGPALIISGLLYMFAGSNLLSCLIKLFT